MVKLTGGGIQSNKTVQSRGYKTEPVTHRGNPAGVAQQGLAVAFKKGPITSGSGYESPKMPATGVAGSKGPDGAGPGGMGRTIYRSGSQGPTPAPREMPAGRDTLSEFGRDIPGRTRC